MTSAGDPLFDVATYTSSGYAFMALLGGRLTVHRGWLHLGDDEHRLLAVFPDGQVEVGQEEVGQEEVGQRDLVYQGRRLQVGQEVQLGGGFVTVRCTALRRGPDWPGEVRAAWIGG